MVGRLITRRRIVAGIGAGVLVASGIHAALAQSPLAGKTIKLVYPFAAGNAGDAVTRILG